MEFVDSYNPLSPNDLAEVEAKVGRPLPKEYKSFLLKHNGGRPVLDSVSHNGEHFDFIGHFYAVRGEMYYNDLVRQIGEHEGMIPKGYLPIGESPGGDVFCLSLKKTYRGRGVSLGSRRSKLRWRTLGIQYDKPISIACGVPGRTLCW